MTATRPQLTDPFRIGGVEIANRVLLAPLAGIGNWFVRLQAKRHGAGLAVSEMVSSFALHHRNERTLRELMRIHPDEHPVSIQLFGHDPEVMRSGAAIAAEAGADLIDINMGCPVRKVRRTGAGAELLRDPELALALARGGRRGQRPAGDREAALGDRGRRPVRLRAGPAAGRRGRGRRCCLSPARRDALATRASPTTQLTRELAESVDVPVIVSGGLKSAERPARAYEESGADAVMIARGGLGNPWLFEELTGRRTEPPSREEVVAELLWVLDRAEEHLGAERAERYLRKFYPWYVAPSRRPGGARRGAAAQRRPAAGAGPDRLPRGAGRGCLGGLDCRRSTPRYNPATSCPGVASEIRRIRGFLGLGANSRLPRKQKRGWTQ